MRNDNAEADLHDAERLSLLEDAIAETIKRYAGTPCATFLAGATVPFAKLSKQDIEWAEQQITENDAAIIAYDRSIGIDIPPNAEVGPLQRRAFRAGFATGIAAKANDAGAVKNSGAPLPADKAPGPSQDYAESRDATPAPAEPQMVPCPVCNRTMPVNNGRLDLHGYMTGPEDAPFVQCSGSGFPLAATPSAPAMDAGDLNGPSQEGADGSAAAPPTAPAEPPKDGEALIDRLRDAIAHYDYDGTVEPVLARLAAPVPELAAENLRLRKIAAHVPGRIYMEAKEKAGYGVQVKAMDAAPVPAREWVPVGPETIDAMLARDGFYVVGDTKHPDSLVPIVVKKGEAYALDFEYERNSLRSDRWQPTAVVYGGFVRSPPPPAADK